LKNPLIFPSKGIVLSYLSNLKNMPVAILKIGDDIVDRRNQHSEVTPHPDGEKESIINDTLSTAGSKIGIEINADPEFTQEMNPFHHQFKPDPSMAQLGKLLGGKKVEE
jgi:hypothetical protein